MCRYLLPSTGKSTKKKTQVVKKTVNPHYDHTFVYKDMCLEQLKGMCLELTVWDREPMSSNDFLGGVRLSSGAGKCLDMSTIHVFFYMIPLAFRLSHIIPLQYYVQEESHYLKNILSDHVLNLVCLCSATEGGEAGVGGWLAWRGSVFVAENDAVPRFMGRGQSTPAFLHGQTKVKTLAICQD